MSTSTQTALRYRMPTVFGPMPGPRQRVGGGRYTNTIGRIEAYSCSFLTEDQYLERLLPPGFSLDGDPEVTVEFAYLSDLQWLAGRGFNSLSVQFPTRFQGRKQSVYGPFLPVVWENMADPIITGREELGFSKLFADIHAPLGSGSHRQCSASWDGHTFVEMELQDIQKVDSIPTRQFDGFLHFRYVPRVGRLDEAECTGAVITPLVEPVEVKLQAQASGKVTFFKSSWEQLPTFVHIVNMLAALPILECRRSTFRITRSDVENAQQRMLE